MAKEVYTAEEWRAMNVPVQSKAKKKASKRRKLEAEATPAQGKKSYPDLLVKLTRKNPAGDDICWIHPDAVTASGQPLLEYYLSVGFTHT